MYQQREPDASSFAIVGQWDPVVLLPDDRTMPLEPTAEDRYAVVDEIIENVVRLAVAPWPQVDAGGRLRFPLDEESRDLGYPLERLQSAVDARRAALGQLTRPLRVGDAFFIRGFDEDDPGTWQLVDITRQSRDAAKRASWRAVAQSPNAEQREAASGDLSWRRPPAEPDRPPAAPRAPSSTAEPVV